MPQYSDLIRTLSAEKFSEVLAASGRKAREVYFHRHGIRAPKAQGLPKSGAKNEFRVGQLFATLQKRDDDELAEEVLRTWLLGKRELLSAALDHLGIAHVGGLTDSDDVGQFAKLSPEALGKLTRRLEEVAAPEDVRVYLTYMGVPTSAS